MDGGRCQEKGGEEMPAEKNGDTVKVHYTDTLNDGTLFSTSLHGDPLEFKIGEGEIIPAFDIRLVEIV